MQAVIADTVAVVTAALVGLLIRGLADPSLVLQGAEIPYAVAAALIVPIWLGLMAVLGGYDRRIFGCGTDEYRKLIATGAYVLAAIALLDFGLKIQVPRGLVAVCVPLAVGLTVLGRFLLRRHLHGSRAHGHSLDRAVLVGDPESLARVARDLRESWWAGYNVVGACSTAPTEPHRLVDDELLHVAGGIADVVPALESLDAEALVVTDASVFPPGEFQFLSWILAEAGVQAVSYTHLTLPTILRV